MWYLFLKCMFLSILATVFDKFKKIKDLHYVGIQGLPIAQILSLPV